ncbi:52 kDa repressor of the inhibitor of the protein kinase-like [Eleginops maclovinus]
MIDVIGKHMIQAKIVEEVRHAQMYTVLADEVTSHNEELMPMCVRFVDKDLNIREELLEICTLPRITGRHIASAIKDVLSHLSIEIADCRGQGYDGASNMSSENVGVQALIKKDAPKAVYMHCNGHCLNLVIARSCALPVVRNMIDKMKYIVMFFTCSPKREHLLKEVVDKEAHSTGKRKPLIDLSRTRWAARHDAYSHFYSAFVASRLMGLIPSVQCNSDVTVDISEAVALYQDDLPSPEVIDQELKRWKLKWQVKALHQRPSSCASAIKECDEMMYPNIFKLLKIACTLPVTSCECERSASVLRRLNTFMRSSMGEDRMSSLALIHTHYDMALDLDEAVDLYSKMHPRRLELMSVLMQ